MNITWGRWKYHHANYKPRRTCSNEFQASKHRKKSDLPGKILEGHTQLLDKWNRQLPHITSNHMLFISPKSFGVMKIYNALPGFIAFPQKFKVLITSIIRIRHITSFPGIPILQLTEQQKLLPCFPHYLYETTRCNPDSSHSPEKGWRWITSTSIPKIWLRKKIWIWKKNTARLQSSTDTGSHPFSATTPQQKSPQTL